MSTLDNGMQASTVKLIYTSNYVRHLVQILCEKNFVVLSQTGKYLLKAFKQEKDKNKMQILTRTCLFSYYDKLLSSCKLSTQRVKIRKHFACS